MNNRFPLGMLLLLLGAFSALAQQPTIKFHFINVGQADATLIEAKCGAILIDAGAQDDERVDHLITYLNAFFERRRDLNRTLEMVGITHNHIDHTKALRRVVEEFTVKRYIDNGQTDGPGAANPRWLRREVEEGRRQIALKEIANRDVLDVPGRRGLTDGEIDPLRCAHCDPSIRVLTGRREIDENGESDELGNKNNHSIVWRVDFGELSLLITGDLEEFGIEDMIDAYRETEMLDIDIYHVGHHGSYNGTTGELLEAMTPTRAVISMGVWNFGRGERNPYTTFRYGHPRLMAVRMLENNVSRNRQSKTVKVARSARDFIDYPVRKAVYGTGWDGSVVMSGGLDAMLRVRLNQ